MADIFLSYAHEDMDRARSLATALTEAGWSVFWDRHIPPGRTFEDYIEAQIKQSPVVLVLWSPHSVTSSWVRLEAAHARDRNPPALIPALIARAEIPFAFAHLQAADLCQWRPGDNGVEFDELLSSIDALVPRENPAAPRPSLLMNQRRRDIPAERSPEPPSASSRSPVGRFWPAGGILAGVVLAVLALALFRDKPTPQLTPNPTPSVIVPTPQQPGSKEGSGSQNEQGGKPAPAVAPGAQPDGRGPRAPRRVDAQHDGSQAARNPDAREDATRARPSTLAVEPSRLQKSELVLSTDPVTSLVKVPAGSFLMGSDKRDPMAGPNEFWPGGTRGSLDLGEFYIGKTEVTVSQFRQCVLANGCAPSNPAATSGEPNHPVVNVAWRDALQYCEWLQRTFGASSAAPNDVRELLNRGWKISLPSEAEWEKAARGTDGRTYPWGEGIGAERVNYTAIGGRVGGILPVGSFLSGASPYGILDMSGNVWEWTRSLPRAYPYIATDGREDLSATGPRVLRGGSFNSDETRVRAAYRTTTWQESRAGFRIAMSHF